MRKIVSLLITVILWVSMIPMTANALVVDDWEIEISGNEATIIGYTGVCPDKITLPTQIGNFPVVGLKANIFSENVEEIIIPEGYKYMTEKSMPRVYERERVLHNAKASLKKITLPESLEILDISFADCSELVEINIPTKVKRLGEVYCDQGSYTTSGIFENCTNLKTVNLHTGLEYIGLRTFSKCTSLRDFTIPSTVTAIKGQAFYNCDSLVNMIIPDSVVEFGGRPMNDIPTFHAVFGNCKNLESVVFGDGISSIGRLELTNCPKLKNVYLGQGITDIRGYLTLTNGGKIFENCSSFSKTLIETIILPESIQTIQSGFLLDSTNMKEVVIPKSVQDFSLTDGKNYIFTDNLGKPLPKLFIYGYADSLAKEFAYNNGFPFIDISVATPTNSKVLINGKEIAFTAYNIGGNNYFKLRDIASAINGTIKNFSVGWDGNNNAIALSSKASYTNVGGELDINAYATATEPKISNPKIFVDGKLTTFMAFNIADNNYIKLRDLGEVFDFAVNWNESMQTIEINTNIGYTN